MFHAEDLSNNLSLRVWELFTEEIYSTDSLCTVKHLLLPAQVEKGCCFRQRFTEYVLVPLKHKREKKSINSLLSVLYIPLDLCNAPFNE